MIRAAMPRPPRIASRPNTRTVASTSSVRSTASTKRRRAGGADHSEHDRAGASIESRRRRRECDPDQRGDERDQQGEGDDLAAAVVAGDEELGVLPEQVEQRLGDGEPAEPEDDERCDTIFSPRLPLGSLDGRVDVPFGVANTYAANFGDVVKHGVLCEAVAREPPMRYLESHGGRLDYDLAEIEPGPGASGTSSTSAPDYDQLDECTYVQLIRRSVGTRQRPGTYPGSIALAAALLPAKSEVVAFELVPRSATDLADGLAAIGRSATVQVADGLSRVCELARPGDLVLLDPFHVTMPAANDFTAQRPS